MPEAFSAVREASKGTGNAALQGTLIGGTLFIREEYPK